MARRISNETRQFIIKAHKNRHNHAEIANMVCCHRTTIKRIVDIYLNEERNIAKLRGGKGPKFLMQIIKIRLKNILLMIVLPLWKTLKSNFLKI